MKKLLGKKLMILVVACFLSTSLVLAYDLYESEPNNTLDTASSLYLKEPGTGTWKKGYITSKDPSVDFYRFYYDRSKHGYSINVMLEDIPWGCDYDLAVLNQYGQVIDKSESTSFREEINLKNMSSGTYYIKVYSYRGTSPLAYMISVGSS